MKHITKPLWTTPTTTRTMDAIQRAKMQVLMSNASLDYTGYEPIPVMRLREDASIHRLLDMLETCRPGDSKSEEDYLAAFIKPLEPFVDEFGNHIIEVPIPDGVSHPRILWSTHTDTVHWHDGKQKVEVTMGMAWTSNGSCLGSDDTVGNWLALEMIAARVPGVYVFHREEETGGGGSMWLAKHAGEWLGQFDCAIALDRAGYSDVITHQAGGRCCSDKFAQSISDLLGGTFKPCSSGVFTDTANYVDHVGECTNLSVGYFKQHGPMEHTNLSFASSLRDALVSADWSALVFERKPGEEDPDWYAYDDKYGSRPSMLKSRSRKDRNPVDEMEEYVSRFPWIVAEYLVEMGVTTADLDDFDPDTVFDDEDEEARK